MTLARVPGHADERSRSSPSWWVCRANNRSRPADPAYAWARSIIRVFCLLLARKPLPVAANWAFRQCRQLYPSIPNPLIYYMNAAPRTLTELSAAFDRECIDPRCYSFSSDGNGEVHRIEATRDSIGNKWHVYYAERGLRSEEVIFRSEAEACELVYKRIMRDPSTRLRSY